MFDIFTQNGYVMAFDLTTGSYQSGEFEVLLVNNYILLMSCGCSNSVIVDKYG